MEIPLCMYVCMVILTTSLTLLLLLSSLLFVCVKDKGGLPCVRSLSPSVKCTMTVNDDCCDDGDDDGDHDEGGGVVPPSTMRY